MKKRNQYLKAGSIITTFAISFVVAILTLHSITEPIIVQQINEDREWRELKPLGADPGSGLSGVINVSIVKHGCFDYGANLTRNASMFAWGETNDTEIGTNVPYGIFCDIVLKVVWNRTMMYNVSNSNWTWTWVNATIAFTLVGYTAGYPGSGGHGHNITGEWNISEGSWAATNDRTYAYYVFGAGAHTGDAGGAATAAGNNNGFRLNRSQRIPTVYFREFAYY